MSSTTQSESAFAEINGARLYYEIAGQGRPLVLIHAGIADSGMWDDQLEAFARHFRVVRYDARGFGRSTMPPTPFARYDDLRGLLDYLGIERAILIGSSMGGATAVDATLAYPEMVAALVLVVSPERVDRTGCGVVEWRHEHLHPPADRRRPLDPA